jgi:hypothetical protein
MIESGIILAGAGVLTLVLVACLLARRPAAVPVTVRIQTLNTQSEENSLETRS